MTEKYLLLIVEDPAIFEAWTPERYDEHARDHAAFAAAIVAAGAKQLASEPLDDGATRFRPVTAPGGVGAAEPPLVTDGPFAETKEIVLGFYLLEVADEAQARELAALCPTMGYIELRKAWSEK